MNDLGIQTAKKYISKYPESMEFSWSIIYPANILSTKRNAMILFAILGVKKIIDFKNCFNSVVYSSNKHLDCIVSS